MLTYTEHVKNAKHCAWYFMCITQVISINIVQGRYHHPHSPDEGTVQAMLLGRSRSQHPNTGLSIHI